MVNLIQRLIRAENELSTVPEMPVVVMVNSYEGETNIEAIKRTEKELKTKINNALFINVLSDEQIREKNNGQPKPKIETNSHSHKTRSR